jgi:hypothetical protein
MPEFKTEQKHNTRNQTKPAEQTQLDNAAAPVINFAKLYYTNDLLCKK